MCIPSKRREWTAAVALSYRGSAGGPPIDAENDALELLRRGDPAGLDRLFRLHGDRVYRLCRGVLCHDADAEDATQEVFLRVLEKIHLFDGRSRFTTWLHVLALRHALNRRSARRREEERRATSPVSLEPAARAEPGASNAPDDTVQHLMRGLAPEQRAVLVLREIEGLSYQEIAEVMGVRVGTVMSRLHRAREALRRQLGRDGRPARSDGSASPSTTLPVPLGGTTP